MTQANSAIVETGLWRRRAIQRPDPAHSQRAPTAGVPADMRSTIARGIALRRVSGDSYHQARQQFLNEEGNQSPEVNGMLIGSTSETIAARVTI